MKNINNFLTFNTITKMQHDKKFDVHFVYLSRSEPKDHLKYKKFSQWKSLSYFKTLEFRLLSIESHIDRIDILFLSINLARLLGGTSESS